MNLRTSTTGFITKRDVKAGRISCVGISWWPRASDGFFWFGKNKRKAEDGGGEDALHIGWGRRVEVFLEQISHSSTGWWFPICFIFIPIPGEMIQFD